MILETSRIFVTDHAVRRYIERVGPLRHFSQIVDRIRRGTIVDTQYCEHRRYSGRGARKYVHCRDGDVTYLLEQDRDKRETFRVVTIFVGDVNEE